MKSRATWTHGLALVLLAGVAVLAGSCSSDSPSAMAPADDGAVYSVAVDSLLWGEQKLLAADGAAGDEFGNSVAIEGDTAIVGAGAKAFQRGAAYVFTRSGSLWTQQAKLTASDGVGGDRFGAAVALSGDTVIVGAFWDDDQGMNSGSAYLFVKPANGWPMAMQETAKLTASDGAMGDTFGMSVALFGDTAIVGAPRYPPGGAAGKAYVFVKPANGWTSMTETVKLTASDGAAGDLFGGVALFGDTAIVGARYADVDMKMDQGAAYVFVKPANGWPTSMTETVKLTASDGAAGDGFGGVALLGDTAIVGAPGADVDMKMDQGAAYVFVKPANGWATTDMYDAKLTASDGAVGDNFGNWIALSGDTAIVGAWVADVGGNSNQGAAYVFAKPMNGWATTSLYTMKLTASDGAALDEFGISIALSGGTAIVGGVWDDDNGMNSGSAYVYTFALKGESCTTSSSCWSRFCVDGVCCDSACGANLPNDCQACSVAEGATADGTCTPLTASACDDGNGCTQPDTCEQGTCAGVPVTCPNGMACIDGSCGPNLCVGVTCPAPPSCKAPGTCNPLNGYCSFPDAPGGTVCDDGDACTETSQCQSGTCIGTQKKCPALDSCHGDGACDPQDGQCKYYPELCSDPTTPVVLGSPCNTDARKTECEAQGFSCIAEGPKDASTRPRVCCNEPCDTLCYSCAVPGHAGECMPEPHGVDLRKDCGTGDNCVRTCSGKVDGGEPTCIEADPGTQCSPPRCIDPSHSLGPGICPEYGAPCPEGVVDDCGVYSCNPVDGTCHTGCATVADCAPGYACRLGRCEAPPPVSQTWEGSCALSPRRSRAGSSSILAAVVIAMLAARRRREQRQTPGEPS